MLNEEESNVTNVSSRAVFINSLLLSAEIEMNGMIAENDYRKSKNEGVVYDKKAFDEIIKKYSILRLAQYLSTSDDKFSKVIDKLEASLGLNEDDMITA